MSEHASKRGRYNDGRSSYHGGRGDRNHHRGGGGGSRGGGYGRGRGSGGYGGGGGRGGRGGWSRGGGRNDNYAPRFNFDREDFASKFELDLTPPVFVTNPMDPSDFPSDLVCLNAEQDEICATGIIKFLRPGPKFNVTFKRYCADFIVEEIDLNNQVLSITSTALPPDQVGTNMTPTTSSSTSTLSDTNGTEAQLTMGGDDAAANSTPVAASLTHDELVRGEITNIVGQEIAANFFEWITTCLALDERKKAAKQQLYEVRQKQMALNARRNAAASAEAAVTGAVSMSDTSTTTSTTAASATADSSSALSADAAPVTLPSFSAESEALQQEALAQRAVMETTSPAYLFPEATSKLPKEARRTLHQCIRNGWKGLFISDTVSSNTPLITSNATSVSGDAVSTSSSSSRERQREESKSGPMQVAALNYVRVVHSTSSSAKAIARAQSFASSGEGDGSGGGSVMSSVGGGGELDKRSQQGMYWKGGEHCRFLRFTVTKSNRDTMELVMYLSKLMRATPKLFSYAGTKDKRGVTSQRLCVYKQPASRLLSACSQMPGAPAPVITGLTETPEVVVGNFVYASEPLRLGDLVGNKFTITIRDIVPVAATSADAATAAAASVSSSLLTKELRDALLASCESVAENGFLNYYGSQRFGSLGNSHYLGRALLRRDWAAFVKLLLVAWPNERKDVMAARELFKTTLDIPKVLDKLPPFLTAERTVLLALMQQGPRCYYNASLNIPRMIRMLYLHAYQSYVWNTAASVRVDPGAMGMTRESLLKPIEGDLVVIMQPRGPGQQQRARRNDGASGAKTDISNSNSNSNSNSDATDAGISEEMGAEEVAPTSAAAVDAGDAEEAEGDYITSADIHVVTADDAAADRFTLADVVLPTPGHDVVWPRTRAGEAIKEILRRDGLDDVCKVFNSDSHSKDFFLPGGYRRLVLKPKKFTYELVQVQQQQQQQQENMMALGSDASAAEATSTSNSTSTSTLAASLPGGASPSGCEWQLKLIFELPSSTYATMVLREVFKGTVVPHRPQTHRGGDRWNYNDGSSNRGDDQSRGKRDGAEDDKDQVAEGDAEEAWRSEAVDDYANAENDDAAVSGEVDDARVDLDAVISSSDNSVDVDVDVVNHDHGSDARVVDEQEGDTGTKRPRS